MHDSDRRAGGSAASPGDHHSDPDRRLPPRPSVSVVVPTYDEAGNIETLLDRLTEVLAPFAHEIIVVDDDSPDRTWELVQRRAVADRRIRLIRRFDQRGLASAVLAGMDAADGTAIAVIDADFQHDESVLPSLVGAILDGRAEIAVGSRLAPGGSYGSFGRRRRLLSAAGTVVAHRLLGVGVTDPMSGFFAVSRERVDRVRLGLRPRGFKILVDLLAAPPRPRVVEVPYRFRTRRSGDTKLDASIGLAFVATVARATAARAWSPRALPYGSVALAGMSLRLTLSSLVAGFGGGTLWSLVAVEAAVLAEYLGHRHVGFADRSRVLPGRSRLVRFHVVALNGVLAQVGLAAVVAQPLAAAGSPVAVVAVFAGGTLGLAGILLATYRLHRAVTWPDDDRDALREPEAPLLDRAQSRRPSTTSTSEAISSTARR